MTICTSTNHNRPNTGMLLQEVIINHNWPAHLNCPRHLTACHQAGKIFLLPSAFEALARCLIICKLPHCAPIMAKTSSLWRSWPSKCSHIIAYKTSQANGRKKIRPSLVGMLLHCKIDYTQINVEIRSSIPCRSVLLIFDPNKSLYYIN